MAMKAPTVLALCSLLAPLGVALADTNSTAVNNARALNPPKMYTGVYQPKGSPTRSSAFAPRPHSAGQHVFGAPIQAPILKRQPKKPAVATTPRVR
jgi:hypothetical protein